MLLLLSYCERLTDFFIGQCGLPETRRSWYIYALQTRISMFLSTAGMMLLGFSKLESDLFGNPAVWLRCIRSHGFRLSVAQIRAGDRIFQIMAAVLPLGFGFSADVNQRIPHECLGIGLEPYTSVEG